MNNNLTKDTIEASITSVYDSFNLIKDLQNKDNLSEDESLFLNLNLEHLQLKLADAKFVSYLSQEQLTELKTV